MTGGAATQQVPIGGFCSTDVSSSVSVSGRWVTHTCCFESTKTPVTAPMIHLFGISSGQLGSTLNVGTPRTAGAPGCWPATAGGNVMANVRTNVVET